MIRSNQPPILVYYITNAWKTCLKSTKICGKPVCLTTDYRKDIDYGNLHKIMYAPPHTHYSF